MSTPTGTSSHTSDPATTSPGTTRTGSPGGRPDGAGPSGGPVPRGFVPVSATFVSPDDGWVLGDAPCSSPPCTSLVRTRDGGRTWIGIPAPRAVLGEPRSARDGQVAVVRFADALDGWAGVAGLYSTHNGGATWHEQRRATGGSDVAALASTSGWIYASTDNCPSQGGNHCSVTTRVYASPVGRDEWRPVSPTLPGTGYGLIAQDGVYVLATLRGIYVGSHGGEPSQRANPCPRGRETDGQRPVLAAADAEHLDAMCTNGAAAGVASFQLYGTTDGGAHWTRAGPSLRTADGISELADNERGVLLAADDGGTVQILRSTDDGTTFRPARVRSPEIAFGWNDLGFTTPTRAVAVQERRAMYLSDDAGLSFRRVRF